MITYDSKFPVMVQTKKGIVPINTTNVGDVLYEYESGHE